MTSTFTESEDLATLARLVEAGRIHPEICLVADWADTNKAIRRLLDRGVRGNAVLTVRRESRHV